MRDFYTLVFLWTTYCLDDFLPVAKHESTYSSRETRMSKQPMQSFFVLSRNRCVSFCVMSSPFTHLPDALLIEGGTGSSVSGQVHLISECRLHATSWAMGCPRQGIGRDRTRRLRFCDACQMSHRLASKANLFTIRVFLDELQRILIDGTGDIACSPHIVR